jgi:hypothetical protein
MNREQAIVFVQTINAIQLFVPPFMYSAINTTVVAQIALAVANGSVICEVKHPHTDPVRPEESS